MLKDERPPADYGICSPPLLGNSGAAPGTPGFGTSGDPIVLSGAQRGPGAAVKKSRKGSRKLIKVPQVVLAYRKAGKLVVTMKLSRSARTALGRAKNAKMSVGTIAVDVFKNQDSDRKKLKIKR